MKQTETTCNIFFFLTLCYHFECSGIFLEVSEGQNCTGHLTLCKCLCGVASCGCETEECGLGDAINCPVVAFGSLFLVCCCCSWLSNVKEVSIQN